MRRVIWWLSVATIAAAPLAGQVPNRENLQRQVMERFIQNFHTQAGLSGQQADQFREIMTRSFRERRQHEARQRQLFRALEGQLRPGVAADEDSLTSILGQMRALRQTDIDMRTRDDAAFAALLTPVQQAQLFISLERLQRQIENILRRRAQGRMQGDSQSAPQTLRQP